VKVEIITIGDELLDGTRVDTNTAYLGSRLAALGAEIVRATTVPDSAEAVRDAIERALEAADLVVVTGGLGPTADDRTKEVAARLQGRRLVLDEEILARVREHFEGRGARMPEVNVAQAMIPEGARAIENRVGTAPGLVLEHGDGLLVLLPGVPSEMKPMVDGYLVPFLEGRGLRRTWEERLLRTTGLAESEIAERIGPVVKRLARTDVAYLPATTGVDLRITARGGTRKEAAKAADRALDVIAAKLDPYVYARGGESLEEVVAYLLVMARRSVAVAESCTGGRLGWLLTRVPGSSEYFAGGVVAYSNDLKRRLLGVRAATLKTAGAVSQEVAIEMARGVRAKARADYGVAITGIAGPGGGSPEKPVGLVYVAVHWDGGELSVEHRFGGGRDGVRERAAQAALELLRRVLLGIADD